MKKIIKILSVLLLVALIGGTAVNLGWLHQLEDKLEAFKKQNMNRYLAFYSRMIALEDDVSALPVGGEPHTADSSEETEDKPADTDTMETTPAETQVSLETVEEADTTLEVAPTEETTAADADIDAETQVEPSMDTRYIIRSHNGIIGVFDPNGMLFATLNVYVMTLPEADRRALEEGIPASDMREVQALLDKFV